MSMTIRKNDEALTIQIDGSLGFTDVREFREAYETSEKRPRYVIDFAKVDHIDSAALGMLLLMKKHVQSAEIELINCKNSVAKIFQISRFDKKFKIS